MHDDIAAATKALKDAEAGHAKVHRGALGQPGVQLANEQRQLAHTQWRDSQLRKREADIADAEQQAATMATTLAQVETEITTAASRLSALREQHGSGQRDLAALRNRIADLIPKPRRRVIVSVGDDVDPVIPPTPLALLAVDEWQRLFTTAREQRSASAVVVFDEINGWLLEVEHHRG
jgi:hypothetical protein